MLSAEPDVGLDLTTLRSRSDTRGQTLNSTAATQAPLVGASSHWPSPATTWCFDNILVFRCDSMFQVYLTHAPQTWKQPFLSGAACPTEARSQDGSPVHRKAAVSLKGVSRLVGRREASFMSPLIRKSDFQQEGCKVILFN